MRVVVGADHAGFPAKSSVIEAVTAGGHEVTDVGTYNSDPVDFPDVAKKLCDEIRNGGSERGILVCGTGQGAVMAANKLPGIRAALAHDTYSAHQCVEHDAANVLCLGAQIVGPKLLRELVVTYLAAKWEATEDLRRRVEKLDRLRT